MQTKYQTCESQAIRVKKMLSAEKCCRPSELRKEPARNVIVFVALKFREDCLF